MNRTSIIAAMLAAALMLAGCSGSSDAEPGDTDVSAIERYREVLTSVVSSQQALAGETAMFTSANWPSVAKRSLELAEELEAGIERLKAFDEATPAAAALQLEVGRLRRELRRMDAESWQDVLPDLALLAESIRSGMDELEDLAAQEPDMAADPEHAGHDHDHDTEVDL